MVTADAEVYEKYADELVRFAAGLVGPDDAPDVVAEVFAKGLTTRAWRRAAEPRAYLYRSVLNEVRMRHRSRMRRRARELRAGGIEVVRMPELRPDVLEAVGGLSPRQRAVVVLTYWEDLTPRQVADRLGVAEGSVRRHLARARERLREVLGE